MKQCLFFIICLNIVSFLYAGIDSDTGEKEPSSLSKIEQEFPDLIKDTSKMVDEYINTNKIDCNLPPEDITHFKKLIEIIEEANPKSIDNFFGSDAYNNAVRDIKTDATFGSIFYDPHDKQIIAIGHQPMDWTIYETHKKELSEKGKALLACFPQIRNQHVIELKEESAESKEQLDNTLKKFGIVVTFIYRSLLNAVKIQPTEILNTKTTEELNQNSITK